MLEKHRLHTSLSNYEIIIYKLSIDWWQSILLSIGYHIDSYSIWILCILLLLFMLTMACGCQIFNKKVAIENQTTNQLHFELSISCEYLCLILWCLSPINLGLFFKENSSNPILRWDYVIIRSVLVDDKHYNGSKALNALDLMQILCYLT